MSNDEFDQDMAYEDLLDDLKKVLHEQIAILKDESKKGKLTANGQRSLLELVKQVKQLAQEELETALKLSNGDLERIKTRSRKRISRLRKNESIAENSGQGSEISPVGEDE